jgi:hypothetical protein
VRCIGLKFWEIDDLFIKSWDKMLEDIKPIADKLEKKRNRMKNIVKGDLLNAKYIAIELRLFRKSIGNFLSIYNLETNIQNSELKKLYYKHFISPYPPYYIPATSDSLLRLTKDIGSIHYKKDV